LEPNEEANKQKHLGAASRKC